MKQWKAFWAKPSHVAYLFVMPVVLLLLIFRLIPTVAAFVCSFFDMDMFLVGKGFVGFQNYIEAFADKRLWNSLWVTIRFTLIEVTVQMVVGLVLAALLTRNTARNKIFRAVYFLPIVCSATAVAIMWRMFLHSNVGIMTYWFELIGIKGVNFLNDPKITFGGHLESVRLFLYLPCRMCRMSYMSRRIWMAAAGRDSFLRLPFL